MKDKISRQAALRRLVEQRSIASQAEMVKTLRDLGFRVTQSSVSRDVRELGLVRVSGRYVPATQLGTGESHPDTRRPEDELIISVEPVGANIIVVKTRPGLANAVGVGLDQRQIPDIAGTVAGDDTIFVAVRSRCAQGRVLALLGGARSEQPTDRSPGGESSLDRKVGTA